MHSTPKTTDQPITESFALTQARVIIESRLAKTARVNLLLIGPSALTESVVKTLWWPDPARTWTLGRPLELPADGGLLFLQDVGHLSRLDQQRLKHWMKGDLGRTQVISTSPAPLMLRLAAGAFDQDLYYRLNTVCVHTSDL